MMKRVVLRAALAAACLLPARGAQAAAPEKLVYAVPVSIPSALVYIAVDKGYFKDAGLEVEPRVFSSGREALVALLAGQAQLQTVSEVPVVHALLQGNDLVTIATIAEHAEAKLIARKDRGILSPKDLAGKRVATLPGTNSDYLMYAVFHKYGIGLDQVKVANMEPPAMVVAYAQGDIDAFFAWEPHIYYAEKQLPERSVVFPPGELYRGWSTVNMDGRYARAHPEVARKALSALIKAEEFAARHPEEAMRLVNRWLKMDEKALAALWKGIVFKVELDRGLPLSMEKVGRWASETKKSGKPLPKFRDKIFAEPLSREKPSAVHL
jgi:NitT/TauT family transport system substrate-binding protein